MCIFQYNTEMSYLITADTLIITPSTRLARLLQAKQNLLAKQENIKLASTTILDYTNWLHRLHQITDPATSILNAGQEHLLWQYIINKSDFTDNLLLKSQISYCTIEAYRLLRDYNVNTHELYASSLKEHSIFIKWMNEFTHLCKQENIISESDIGTLITNALPLIKKSLPSNIIFYAFEEFNPNQERLRNQLTDLGFNVSDEYPIKESNTHVRAYAFSTLDEELRAMAEWAKAEHEKNPTTSITCVVPNLISLREQVKQTFMDVFYGPLQFNHAIKPVFNLSGGYSLYDASPIFSALNLLSLNVNNLNTLELAHLSQTPYIQGYFDEIAQRNQWTNTLKTLYHFPLNFKQLSSTLVTHGALQLENSLSKINQSYSQRNETLTLHEWSNYFHQVLNELGWPGDRKLTSEEYQQVQRFHDALAEYAELDVRNNRYNHHDALIILNDFIKNILFEQETENSSIQVLGLLEAAGLSGDLLWIMHLDDKTLPNKAQSNPLIPIALQKKYNMPHSSSEQELVYSNRLFNRFIDNHLQVQLSYHQHEQDEKLSVSPLLKNNQLIVKDVLLSPHLYTELLEELNDEAVALKEGEKISGGSDVFRSQSDCSFKAFAKHRLHIKPLEQEGLHYNQKQRGIVLHNALEIIWSNLQSHTNLIQLTQDKRHALIDSTVNTVLNEIYFIKPQLRALEVIRLTDLLNKWLLLEAERIPFTIEKLEGSTPLNFGPLMLTIRFDRIDNINNNYFIIDYKSGAKISTTHWQTDRLKEPQCPLYSIALPNASGVALAFVNNKSPQLAGISSVEVGGEKISIIEPDAWTEQRDQWYQSLKKLADEFIEGNIKLNPREKNTCKLCDISSLCRINEKNGNSL